MIKINCTNENERLFLSDLVNKLKTQDNKMTKRPVIYELRDIAYESCDEDESDYEEIYLHDNDLTYTIEDLEELNNELSSHYGIDIREYTSMKQVYEVLCNNDITAIIFYYKKVWVIKGKSFISEEAAKEHIQKFKRSYTDEVNIYIRNEDENTELGKLLSLLEGCEVV